MFPVYTTIRSARSWISGNAFHRTHALDRDLGVGVIAVFPIIARQPPNRLHGMNHTKSRMADGSFHILVNTTIIIVIISCYYYEYILLLYINVRLELC